MSSILIVEDDVTLRELLFELFSETYHCSTAGTAEQALCLLDSKRFDLVLTDISMPGMSGLELLGIVRQRWPETTVIIRFWILSGLCTAGGLGIFYADSIAKGFTK